VGKYRIIAGSVSAFDPPAVIPNWGTAAFTAVGPTIAVLDYRPQQLAGNTAYIEAQWTV
jgi:cobaltochelatase CobN